MIFDPANLRLGNRVHFGKYYLRQCRSTNVRDIKILQTSGIMSLALAGRFFQCLAMCLSPRCLSFYFSIQPIVRMCSNIKMIWVDAQFVVSSWAIVKHKHPRRNATSLENPRRSMRTYYTASSAPTSHRTITNTIHTSCPYPARIGLFYTRPKTSGEVFGQSLRPKVFWSNFNLHNKFSLLCRALGRFSAAEAFQS